MERFVGDKECIVLGEYSGIRTTKYGIWWFENVVQNPELFYFNGNNITKNYG